MVNRYVTWVDPFGPLCKPVVNFILADDVIAEMRESGKAIYHDIPDEQLLMDFVVVNWGEIVTLDLDAVINASK